jgi:hypothetical protein
MNLFCLDSNPNIAAQYNCDQHCNKIVLECAQMMANCFDVTVLKSAPPNMLGQPRKHSYFNHPVSKWMRETIGNLLWSIDHAFALERERIYRGYNPHFSIRFINWVAENFDKSAVPYGDQTEFAVAIAPTMQCRQHASFNDANSVGKYRLYYQFDKPFATWTKRNKPDWFNSNQNQ